MASITAILVLFAIGCCVGNPVEDVIPDISEIENVTAIAEVLNDGRILIEDMIMTREQFNDHFSHITTLPGTGKTIHQRRSIAVTSSGLWPGGRIPYTWSRTFPGSRSAVISAMNEWMKSTCIKFVPRTSRDSKYVVIQDGLNGRATCNADLGYQRRVTGIFLHKGCGGKKTILHELGHCLGLMHEHQHPDRDRYLTIYWNNIDPANQIWFKTKGTTYGMPYDVYSVMHYFDTAFVKKGCRGCKTMASKMGAQFNKIMGKVDKLSTRSDIPVINKIYKCRK